MIKLTSILLLIPLIAASAEAHRDLPGSRRHNINITNDIASPTYGTDLATLHRQVAWQSSNEDQEKCAYGEAKTVGEKVIRKSDCQKIVDHMSDHSGYWTVTGYGQGDVYATLAYRGTCSFEVARVDDQNLNFEVGNTDARYFIEQAIRLSSDPSRLPTVIGAVHCAGENSPLVEWKVGLRTSGALPLARTSAVGWVAVALVAIVLA